MKSRETGLTHPFANTADAFSSLNCDSDLALVQRTRRAIRDAAIAMQEQRVTQRRDTGLAFLILLSILVLLTPAIWTGIEELLAGEHLADLPAQVVGLFILVLWPATLAALMAVWKGRRGTQTGGRT